jgi:predicted transposase/invertase (TIGR01784 family)
MTDKVNNLEEAVSVEQISHDANFKELISTFFVEFLELFVPELAAAIDRDSIRFLQQEYFTDVAGGEKKIIDLLAEVKLLGQDATIVIHLEAQSWSESVFNRRMFYYFSILHQRQVKDIYPIVIFSFDEPYRAEPDEYKVEVVGLKVLEFRFKSIQLNRMNWQDYLNRHNPVAAALMAKMRIAPEDRPKVKAECLRLLVSLKLDPARTFLVSKFVDTYLRLDGVEEQTFRAEVDKMEISQKEEIMQVTTSWEEKGIEKGQRSLLLRLLDRKVGGVSEAMVERVNGLSARQLEALGDALLDFRSIDDLQRWFSSLG